MLLALYLRLSAAGYDCHWIVDDELGRMPPDHGGPKAVDKDGTGFICVIGRF